MIIRTGMTPKVREHLLPPEGALSVQLGVRAFAESIGNAEPMQVWSIHWTREGERLPGDFMLFTSLPDVDARQFTYRETMEMPAEYRRKMDEHYRREHNVPEDAVVTRQEAGDNTTRVTISWYEVTV